MVMWLTLLTVGMSASEIESSEQGAVTESITINSEVVNLDPQLQKNDRNLLAVTLAAVLTMILIGLAGTFITKYIILIRKKNNVVYERKSKSKKLDRE